MGVVALIVAVVAVVLTLVAVTGMRRLKERQAEVEQQLSVLADRLEELQEEVRREPPPPPEPKPRPPSLRT